MPTRLDRVIVATSRREVEIARASRDMLLERLRRDPEQGGDLVRAFEAAGATRPVSVTPGQERQLHAVVQAWSNEVGVRNLPPGIDELRRELVDADAEAD